MQTFLSTKVLKKNLLYMKKNKTIVIAEIGVNHNNDLDIAKKLIQIAKKAGANFVKFQTYKTENLVKKLTKITKYQQANLKKKTNQFQMLKKLELSENDHKKIIEYCKKIKISFLSSPFDIESLNLLFKFKIFNIKIASGEITNFALLKKTARKAKKIFLSTGMSNMKEISDALRVLINNGAKKKDITILHCHSDYPTELKNVKLLAMIEIKKNFKTDVGYSDHTIGFETAIAAVALGAQVIEKHITLNKKMNGPDHAASMEPENFYNFVRFIRKTEILLGTKTKKPSQTEIKTRKLVRKSIVAKKNINKGDLFSEKNIISKRPEGGISSIYWEKIIGKKSKKNFKTDQFISIK